MQRDKFAGSSGSNRLTGKRVECLTKIALLVPGTAAANFSEMSHSGLFHRHPQATATPQTH
jgi:hypothetical protein